MRNTGFIITGPSVCVFVECRQALDKQSICQGQVVEEFINRFMVFKGGICDGRVSGRRRYPEAEVFQYLPYYLLVSDKADDLHLPTTLRTAQRVCLIDLFDTIAPLF